MGRIRIDVLGQKFGRLTVMEFSSGGKDARWLCRCDCGGETIVTGANLRNGSTQSCGCLIPEASVKRRTHGLTGTKLYQCYNNMIFRCYDQRNQRYDIYGGRGIRVCDEWRADRRAFFRWAMANGYAVGLSIERNDVDGNYEPSNCKWIPLEHQQWNTTRTRLLEWNGERLPLPVWADRLGVDVHVLHVRLRRGWPAERVLTQPFRAPRYRQSPCP